MKKTGGRKSRETVSLTFGGVPVGFSFWQIFFFFGKLSTDKVHSVSHVIFIVVFQRGSALVKFRIDPLLKIFPFL
jgi:hypothetical protein